MNIQRYSGLIIGGGAIGAGYDSLQSSEVLTHAHALSVHPRFSLLGIVDSNEKKLVEVTTKWKTPGFKNLEDFKGTADVIAVCVPTALHKDYFIKALKLSPKLIFLEKPIAYTVAHRNEMAQEAKASSTSVLVHYTRRFAPGLRELAQRMRSGEFGKLLAGNSYYTKGWQNNGSHLVDLLRMLLGEPDELSVLGSSIDYSAEDPCLNVLFRFQDALVTCLAGSEKEYSEFSASFLFAKAKVEILDFGFRYTLRKVVNDPVFSNYRSLEPNSPAFTTGLDRSLYHAYEAIAAVLDQKIRDQNGFMEAEKTEHWIMKGIDS